MTKKKKNYNEKAPYLVKKARVKNKYNKLMYMQKQIIKR